MKHRMVWFIAAALGLSLLPFFFAADEPVRNDRKTSGQTKQIIWGDSTNGLRAGLLPGGQADSKLDPKTGRTIAPVFLVLANPSTNMVRFFWPREGQRFALTLRDSHGQLVPRTPSGKAVEPFMEPTVRYEPKQWNRKNYMVMPLWPGMQTVLDRFDPSDFFCVANQGNYTLAVEVRVFLPETNGVLRSVILPAATVHVR